jgi:hypothetical protein
VLLLSALAGLLLAGDNADRLVALITASGKLLSTQRDPTGRIQQVSATVANQNVNLVSSIQTDAAGNTKSQSYGNGVNL